MTYEVTVGDRVMVVTVDRTDEGYRVVLDGHERLVQATHIGAALNLIVDGQSFDAGMVRRDGGYDIDLRGNGHSVDVVDPRRKALRMASGAGEGVLKSSMPGRVISVLVSEGDAVSKGQPLLVLEAMKMENELKAPVEGVVTHVHVAAGDSVETNAKLVEIGPG